MVIRIGTRSSNLAKWQAQCVATALEQAGLDCKIVHFKSMGDQSLGGNLSSNVGQFIHSIDEQLLNGNIDIAVHSSKDVPVQMNEAIRNLAYLKRGPTTDLMLFRREKHEPTLYDVLDGDKQSNLKEILLRIDSGMTFGTVSGRRQSLLLNERPDLIPLAIRGHVETRVKRLIEGRVDSLILAESGIVRLRTTGIFDEINANVTAYRIHPSDWPTAPGQGAVSIHCKAETYDELTTLRDILNHESTETEVNLERSILQMVGGGCLYPAGIEVHGEELNIRISAKNWKTAFCEGRSYGVFSYFGPYSKFELDLPKDNEGPVIHSPSMNPKYISTLNSDRISLVLANNDIEMTNLSVIDLLPKLEAWPRDFLKESNTKREWPYLVLTSPFAAKCAILAAESNPDIARIQWLAIGEGTARACFRRGVTVAICAKARNSKELSDFIVSNIDVATKLLIPRSNLASMDLVDQLRGAGFPVQHWIGYENKTKTVEEPLISPQDVLLISSSSSAVSWAENGFMAPNEIICMGNNTKETILSLEHFRGCNISVLDGPTTEYLIQWWNKHRGD